MRSEPPNLPSAFMAAASSLESAYLASADPIEQSGFGGGEERWRAEREPILDAVEEDGDILDIGCANGYLLECLVSWASERGVALTPHGVDIGGDLIAAAKRRLPACEANLQVANAWDWRPSRRFRYVYALHDCVPLEFLRDWVERLIEGVVEPGGRLIVGAYGSVSREAAPLPIAEVLGDFGHTVTGRSFGGTLPQGGPVTSFAWVDNIR